MQTKDKTCKLIETFKATEWEKVQAKLKTFDVYVRTVDTSKRIDGKTYTSSEVFENLESIRKIRKDKGSIVIGFDTEYQSFTTEKTRIILSYQFAVYMNDNEVLELFFATKNPSADNRLYLKDCMDYIMHYLFNSGKCNTLFYTGAYRLQYYDNNNKFRKKLFNSKITYKEVQSFIKENDIKNVIYLVDRSHVKAEDAKKLKGFNTDITILNHAGIVDISAFKDGHSRTMLRNLTQLQGGVVSLEKGYTLYAQDFAKTYNCEFPLQINVRDTMCFAPKGNQSLDALGKCINVNKIDISKETKNNMLDFFNNDFENFRIYACQDSLVTLMYASRIWGINREMLATITSASANFLFNSVIDFFHIEGKPKEITNVFKWMYDGIITEKFSDIDKNGKVFTNCRGIKSMEVKNVDLYFEDGYVGGWNTCCYPGVFKKASYDYDVIKAYSIAQTLLKDADYSNLIKETYTNCYLTLDMIDEPNEISIANVDFEFPKSVKFPCIPVRGDGNTTYPKSGKKVTICASTIYLALKLGAKLYAHTYIRCNALKTEDGKDSMSLGNACKILSNDRDKCRQVYGDGSIEEMLIKSLLTALYGKLGQGIIDKRKWNSKNDEVVQLERCKVTSNYRAAITTALVRDLLFAIANGITDSGYSFYSVTTDGFISDIPEDKLNKLDGYGLVDLFKTSRRFLSGRDDLWKKKHQQDALLLNATTRCNIGFGTGYDKKTGKFVKDAYGNKGVLAHGSFKTSEKEDSYEDHLALFKTVVERSIDKKPSYKYDEWVKIKEMYHTECDFYTFPSEKKVNFNFDLKRKPMFETMHDVSGTYDGIDYTYAVFETEPYKDIEEYKLYKEVGKSFERLMTVKDWEMFQARIRLKQVGTNLNITDLKWTKLLSVIRLYNQGKVSIPILDKCGTLEEKIITINTFNHSDKKFTKTTWKSCRRKDRMNQVLGIEDLKDLLNEMDAVLIDDTGEQSSI